MNEQPSALNSVYEMKTTTTLLLTVCMTFSIRASNANEGSPDEAIWLECQETTIIKTIWSYTAQSNTSLPLPQSETQETTNRLPLVYEPSTNKLYCQYVSSTKTLWTCPGARIKIEYGRLIWTQDDRPGDYLLMGKIVKPSKRIIDIDKLTLERTEFVLEFLSGDKGPLPNKQVMTVTYSGHGFCNRVSAQPVLNRQVR